MDKATKIMEQFNRRLSSAMSGWQRIGVVISVLWLVGQPVYVQMHENQRIHNLVMNCLDARLPAAARAGGTFAEVEQYCMGVYGPYWRWGDVIPAFCWDPSSFFGLSAGSFSARCAGFDAALQVRVGRTISPSTRPLGGL
jgi:hypothetical protein